MVLGIVYRSLLCLLVDGVDHVEEVAVFPADRLRCDVLHMIKERKSTERTHMWLAHVTSRVLYGHVNLPDRKSVV